MKNRILGERLRNLSANSSPLAAAALILLAASINPVPATAQTLEGLPATGVSFSKAFTPATIGPGSVSTLTFSISSENPDPVTDLAFTDTLPPALTIADPAFVSNSCGGTLSAPEGGSTISLSEGQIGASDSCQITVDVTGTITGLHENVSGDLTSSAGNSGPASATLEIASDRPGFSKSFSPGSVQLGADSTLTFTVDNTLNGSGANSLAFDDQLPGGLEIDDPSNTANTCGGVLTAPAGGNTISLASSGTNFSSVDAGSSCTISVDVTTTAVGTLDNRTSDLTSTSDGFNFDNSGKASASIEVTADDLALIKTFTDDPVPPGGTATLEFSITNVDRSQSATNISFTDDLEATLTGLVATGLPTTDVCGAGSSLEGTSLVSLTGGNLGPGETCTFAVTVQVPADATPGSFPNTTSEVTGDVGGTSVTGAAASDDLVVEAAPVLDKTFLSTPVGAGGSVDLEFTIVNTSSSSGATDIAFTDDFGAVIPGLTATSLPADGFCGPSSTSFGTSILSVSGASLAPAGDPGDSCTFQVTLDVPDGIPSGSFTNTTSEVSATVSGETVTGNAATDDLEVVGAPTLRKEFTDDPVDPGQTATLSFTIIHDEFAPGNATDIAFTDDLDAALAGLAATGLPQTDICGAGSAIDGTSVLSFTGGTLAPGESCTFDVTVQVPAGAPAGSHTNTTNAITATVDGVSATGTAATADLRVSAVSLVKTFVDDPVIPGGDVVLSFTVSNDNPNADATDIFFEDDLEEVLPGLQATDLPKNDVCGAGSLLEQLEPVAGEFRLRLSGGNLGADTSCTFDTTLSVPAGTDSAVYTNTTQNASSTIDGSTIPIDNAQADLVVDATLLALTKEFTDDPGIPGGTVTLQFNLHNTSATETVTDIGFTDDLDAVFTGLASESGTQSDVCGTGSQLDGISVLTLTGASLGPGVSCMFSATLRIPDGASGNALNTTSTVTGDAGGLAVEGLAASDTLRVNNVAFTKAFSGPTTATGTVTLSFTLDNLDTDNGVTGLSFNDDLDAVIPGLTATNTPLTDVCGAGSELGGSSVLTLTGGDLGAGESCTFGVELQVPASAEPGSFNNTTSDLQSNGLLASDPASASLQIEPPPTFGKVFNPNAITVGSTTTLTFTIDNSGSAVAADSLTFTDNLPAGLEVADPPNAASGCGGTLTAAAGAGSIEFSGGSVAAASACTIAVDITGVAEGTFDNITGTLTSSAGDSGTATDTIDVVTGDFVLTKSFRTNPVLPGGLVEMELSIVNGSDFALTDIALTDDLDAVVSGLAAEGLPLADPCGAGSQLTGDSIVSLTDGTLPAGGSCTIVVSVRVPGTATQGSFTNTTSTTTGIREGVAVEAPAASADLTIDLPQFTKQIDPAVVAAGSTVTMTLAITNPDPANALANLTFTDDLDAFLAGATAGNTPVNDACGAGSVLDGTSTLTFTGGQLAGGGSCTMEVTVNIPSDATAGDYTNTTSTLDGEVDGTGINVDPASATLSVESGPVFTKAFAPDVMAAGAVSTLTFTIDNTQNQLDADSLAFTDNLPAGLQVADPPGVSSTCGGTVSATAGGAAIEFTGGSVAGGSSCEIQVDVTTDEIGVFENISGDLTSSLGNSGQATATLTTEGVPVFTKAFAPDVMAAGAVSTLTFTIDNTQNQLDADSLAFTDNLPAGLEVADPPGVSSTCGGTVSATAGDAVIELAGGTVAGGSSCEIQVDVTTNETGVFDNISGDLTSSLGNSGQATATLSVEPVPGFSKAFAPGVIAAEEVTTLTFSIDNSQSQLVAESLAFTDNLPAGLEVAEPPALSNTCGGTLDASAGAGTIELAGGSVDAGSSCEIGVDVTGTIEGSFDNVSGVLSSSLGDSTSATDTLVIVTADFAVTKSFRSAPALPGGLVEMELTIVNGSDFTVTDIEVADNLDAALTGLSAEGLPQSDVCGAGSELSGTSNITLTGGSIAANENCTVVVSLRIPADADPGTYTNETGTASADREGVTIEAAPASADLNVASLAFTKTLAPDTIEAGSEATLSFTISNPDPVNGVDGLSFTDDLDAFVSGMTAIDTPQSDVCGSGSLLDGTATLALTDGSLAAGETCTFEATVLVPASTSPGDYTNTTSSLSGELDGTGFGVAETTSGLSVQSRPSIPVPTLNSFWLIALALGLLLVSWLKLNTRISTAVNKPRNND